MTTTETTFIACNRKGTRTFTCTCAQHERVTLLPDGKYRLDVQGHSEVGLSFVELSYECECVRPEHAELFRPDHRGGKNPNATLNDLEAEAVVFVKRRSGCSAADLADAAGVSPRQINRLASGARGHVDVDAGNFGLKGDHFSHLVGVVGSVNAELRGELVPLLSSDDRATLQALGCSVELFESAPAAPAVTAPTSIEGAQPENADSEDEQIDPVQLRRAVAAVLGGKPAAQMANTLARQYGVSFDVALDMLNDAVSSARDAA